MRFTPARAAQHAGTGGFPMTRNGQWHTLSDSAGQWVVLSAVKS
jgi:hypothetical protein